MATRKAFRRAVPRRPMSWEGAAFSQAALAGAQTVFTIVSEGTLESSELPTIVRVRGKICWDLSVSGAVPAQGHINFGIRVIPTSAIAAPGLVFTDIGSDWLWWDGAAAQISGGTLTAPLPGNSECQSGETIIDSKAMRVTKRNETLILAVQASSIVSTVTFRYTGFVRVLLKHH